MRTKHKVVVFDWGGVIESHKEGEYNLKLANKNLIKRFNSQLSDHEIETIYYRCLNLKNNRSISTYNEESKTKEWFNNLKEQLNLSCTIDEFLKAYYEEYKKIHYYKDVVEYVHSLKKECKIAIFSNLMKIDGKRINEQVKLKTFDYVFLSYELGYKKPDPKFYEEVEKRLNRSPQDILFIDDTLENIEMAKQRGWYVCLVYGDELEKIKKVVNEFLYNENQ